MQTDGGWVSISEAAKLYSKSRKWVYDQIERYGLETQKEGNRTRLRLVDLIAQRGEPQGSVLDNSVTHTTESQKITPPSAPETELLKQENQFLKEKIGDLEADKAERQAREARWEDERARLEGIIERQTYALPTPDESGALARFVQWLTLK